MPSRAERGECSALHDRGPGRERSGGGIIPESRTTPLFEGTPPTLGGEFKVLDNSYIITKEKNEQLALLVLCGKGGIRTPGASQHGGFQDRCNRPLYHLSSSYCRCSFSKAMQRYTFLLYAPNFKSENF